MKGGKVIQRLVWTAFIWYLIIMFFFRKETKMKDFTIKAIIITILANISILFLGFTFTENIQIQLKDVKTGYIYTVIDGVQK